MYSSSAAPNRPSKSGRWRLAAPCYLEPRFFARFNAFDTAIGSSKVKCLLHTTEAKKFATQGSEIGGLWDQPRLSGSTTTYMVVNPPQ